MVVESGGKRVALECDGDKWHTLDNLAEDMSRQAILERLGWRFIRIRGSEFFRDPDEVMTKIVDRLIHYEIYPQERGAEEQQSEAQSEGLKDTVIRLAEVIRKQWNGEEETEEEAEEKTVQESEVATVDTKKGIGKEKQLELAKERYDDTKIKTVSLNPSLAT